MKQDFLSLIYKLYRMEARTSTFTFVFLEFVSNRAWDLRKKNRKKYWNLGDNKP